MISLVYFIFSSLLCVLASNLIGISLGENKGVVDVFHSVFPKIEIEYSSDILIFLQILYSAIFITEKQLAELLFILGSIQFSRLFCFTSTILPPLKSYKEKIRIGGLNGTGSEYIFSGHASYACVSAIYLYTNNLVPLYSLIFYNLFSQGLIVLTRNHYSVDVILAWIVSSLFYASTQLCLENEKCRGKLSYFFSPE